MTVTSVRASAWRRWAPWAECFLVLITIVPLRPCWSAPACVIYVGNTETNSVSVVDLAAGSVREVPGGAYPSDVALSPDGRRLYVTNAADASLSIFEADTMNLIKTLPLNHTNPGPLLMARLRASLRPLDLGNPQSRPGQE